MSRIATARHPALLPSLAALAAVMVPLIHSNDADIDALTNALTYVTLALGLNIVVGFTGLLDLGYAAFFAIGAYAYGILASFQLMPHWSPGWAPLAWLDLVRRVPGDAADGGDVVRFTVSFWLMLPGSALLAALCGILFGAPTLRLRGDYLAIVTLGFGEIVPIVARNWTELTNGAEGLNGIAAPHLFGWRFGIAAWPYYYVALAMVAALIVVSRNLAASRIGRAWMAIREDEIAAGAAGIDPTRFKLLAFALGAAFAGMAGASYVAKLHTATPEMFGFPVSAMILVMVVLGGLGSVWGVVLGAMLLSLLQSWFLVALSGWLHALGRLLANAWLQQVQLAAASELIFGVILVAMMLFRRDGLIPARTGAEPLHADETITTAPATWSLPPIAPADPPALVIRGLTVRFGGLIALDALDLTVPAGALVAVIGPNGSGKSTLFNVVTGLTPAAAGSVRLFGRDVTRARPHRILAAGAARTFQNIRLFPTLSVLDNVLIGRHARLRTGPLGAILRLPRARAEEARATTDALHILALFGDRLLPRRDQSAASLTYANRRRLEIARALASRPRLLLLDEPTAGMTPTESLELAGQIARLRSLGLTILLIEHKLDVVTRLADTIVVLDHGELLTQGTAAQIREHPAVLTAYLGRTHAA